MRRADSSVDTPDCWSFPFCSHDLIVMSCISWNRDGEEVTPLTSSMGFPEGGGVPGGSL